MAGGGGQEGKDGLRRQCSSFRHFQIITVKCVQFI